MDKRSASGSSSSSCSDSSSSSSSNLAVPAKRTKDERSLSPRLGKLLVDYGCGKAWFLSKNILCLEDFSSGWERIEVPADLQGVWDIANEMQDKVIRAKVKIAEWQRRAFPAASSSAGGLAVLQSSLGNLVGPSQ